MAVNANERIDVRLPGRGANPVIRGEQQVEVNTGGQPQIQPTQRPVVDVEDVTPVQYQQSQYVGQGFTGENLDERQRVGEQVQRDAQTAAQPATPVAQQPQRPQQPQQSASQMSGMAEAQQVQQAQQSVPQEAQEAQPEPELTVPNPSELPTASKRERTSSLDLAMEAGDRLANMGVARAQARERVAQAEEKKTEPSEQDVRSARPVNMRSLEDKALQSMADDEEPSPKEPFWAKPIERVIRFSENFDIRPKALIDSYKKRAARAFKSEGVGNRIYGKMMGLGTLDFREVGVGLQEILAVRDQNTGTLERLIGPELLEGKPPIATMSARELVNLINNNEIYVATYKPPNNQGQDMQRRKLKVLTQQQRGIYLHNIMAAMYTADYDGDDMEVSLDPVSAQYTKDPMDYLVDMFGKISLNSDFLPVTPIKDVKDSDGNVTMKARDYVKEIILGDFVGMVRDERSLTPLVDAIMDLGDTALNGKKQDPAWGKVFTEARKLADRIDHRNSNKLMSDICRAVFDSMQRNKYYSTMNIVGPDVLHLTMDEIPKPRTISDRMIYDVFDSMVKGTLPGNFQELKLMLTGYTGNIEGKNAPFRFTADVGKMMKMDERFKVGNEYVIDPNNDKHMEMFFQSTVKFAGSLKMARDIKTAGRSQYYTQVMRENVLREVGFPDMMVPIDPDNPDGPKRYRYARNIGTAENPKWVQDFGKFLAAFTWSYRKHSTLINEANTVFLSSMAISDDDTRGIVSPLKSSEGGVTLGDLAEPMSSIYGTYSVGRVFSGLFANVSTGDDPHWIGRTMKRTDNAIEREYDQRYTKQFWVTNRYANYSIRRFKNENRLLRGSEATDEEKEQDKQVKDSIRFISSIRAQKVFKITDYYMEHNWKDYDIQFDMLLAIADKRTSAASTYNRKIFGDIADNPFSYMNTEDRSTIKMLSVLLTSVAKSMREGNQAITPGYYAGIGQRNLPKGEEGKDVMRHMTSLAKKLNGMGWVLRSGDAKGSDQAFQRGAGRMANIYISESGQKPSKSALGFVSYLDKMSSEDQKVANDSVVRLHPSHGKNLDNASRGLLARDYFQVMGSNGEFGSAFIACYADSEERGTYQAIRVAREQGIPVFNAAEYTDLDQWEQDVIDAAVKAGMGQLRTEKVSLNQANEIETAIRAIIMSNPDIFMHYNMDSPAGFLESPFGKKMLQYADDPGKLGGIYTAMVFDYRMERINALTSEFLNQRDTAKIQRVWDDLLLAKDELSSASETWHALIREFEAESTPGMKSFFQMMHDNKPVQHTKVVNKQGVEVDFQYPWGPKPIKDGDWAMVREKGYPNLRAIIEDLDLDLKSKRDIIADVVRYWEKDAYLKSYEVPYQLEVGNDSTYVLGGGAQTGLTTMHKDFEQAFNGWAKKSHILLREDVDRAKSKFSKYPGRLMETIKRLDEEPFELIAIDDEMYADSILSVYDKTYAQTEKASQNPWTNAIYAALSYQQLGGYMNDIQRTDDRLLGLTAASSVGVQDIIHLFANPEEYLTVYDKYGRIGMISRDILLSTEFPLSNDVEADMWRFLSMQPRVAAAIRKHSACVKNDSDGEGYLGAKASITETIESLGVTHDHLSHVKYLMRDHPAYAAIISLALPGKNLISRTARRRIKEIEDFLAYDLYMAASSGYDSATAAQMILNDLTITNEGLRAAMRSDYDTFLEKLGLEAYKYTDEKGRLESEVDADITYNYALERMTAYVEEVRASNVVLGEPIEMPKIPGKSERRHTGQIARFRDNAFFLSNFYDTPVTIDGITYRNSEAAFQAQKCVNKEDKMKFVNLDGASAKKLGRKVKLRDDWDSIKVDVMRKVIHAKFSNPEMRSMLKSTNNMELIEGNTHGDTFWGVSRGRGENMLGKILMEERGDSGNVVYETYDTGVDAVSAAAFWDVVQELSGAKTAVSTGIEGSETYRYANWVSHIRARDKYATLDTIEKRDLLRGGFDGAWTNITGEDGGTIFLEVDNGEIVNMDLLKKLAGDKEIIVSVPEGYIVRDRSTDTNGTQVASLMAYMVSKRSNGAEAFNLKAKKAGIDGKDSITKKLPGGKHRMGTDYYQILLMLQNLARRRGIDAAKLRLAEMMLAENNLIGYDDMTLANYMSIADIMLIEGQDGEVYLRSLEMLLSAIKYRIGFKVDDMTDDQLFEAVDQIVNDNSENGVGINRMMDNPIAALDNLRPASISTQHSAMRQNSSVFTRNYDLLMEIASTAHSMGVEPMDPENAGRLDKKLRDMMSAKDVKYNLSDVTDNYNFIGWVGAPDCKVNLNWSVGPSNAIFIGGYPIFDAAKNEYVNLTSDDVLDICQEASELGMTVIFDDNVIDLIPKYYLQSAVEIETGKNDPSQYLIPNFDMRLNGSEATPFKPHFAIGQVDYSELVVSVEDPVNEFGLGDAEAIAMKGFVDRVKVFDGRSEQIKAEDLFPNVMKNPAFGGTRYDYVVGLATGREIKNLIVDGVRCTIDYGIPEGAKGFDQRKKDVDAAIERYRARWQNANSDGIMMGEKAGELEPGDIVAFAVIGIIDKMDRNNKQYAFAPIIPFPLHGVKRQPSLYSIGNIGKVDDDSILFHVDWSNVSDITKHFVKYFDSSGGANKQMMDMTQAIDEDRVLLDGTPVDVYIAKASTDSRKVGTDRRIKTMITLMMKARMNGYNFARKPDGSMNPDAFPDNPEIRERLYRERIPFGEWKQLLGSGIRFVTDDTLNAFITYECRKILDDEGNPSDYLANIYTDENGVESDTHVMWEFECMFEQGLNYEDGLLRFLSFVNPIASGSKVKNFCPNGITDNSNDCLFRLQQDANGEIEQGYDRGVLQMRIPHKNQIANGVMSYTWGNVSIGKSFFGEEYSGFSRPNVAGASLFLDGMNTMSMYGKRLKPSLQRQRNYWATADIGRIRGNSSMEVTEEE